MRTLASSEDPDEMPHNAFHQGLHCLLFGKNAIQRQKILFLFKNNYLWPLDIYIYTMDHPMFIASNQKEESITA